MFYLPKFKAFCAAEDATHTLHNLYTLRGAKMRDGLLVVEIPAGGARHVRAGHRSRVRLPPLADLGQRQSDRLPEGQRDTYRYLHDQVMRMANGGMTPKEIGEAIRLPKSLATQWACRSYYGSVYHDAVAQYNLRLGFFDGVPATLHQHPPVEAGRALCRFMGGADDVLRRAKQSFDQGDYRWVAEVVNHVVFADGSNVAGQRASRGCLRAARLSVRVRAVAQLLSEGRTELRQASQASGSEHRDPGHHERDAARIVLRLSGRPAERGPGRGQDSQIQRRTHR